MALRSPQERRFESLDIIIAHAEFGDLKTQQLQEICHRESMVTGRIRALSRDMTAAISCPPAMKYSTRVAFCGKVVWSFFSEKSAGASRVAFSRS